MDEDVLDDLLDELRTTLGAAEGLTEGDRERLGAVVERIEEVVEDEHHGVVDQIEDAVHRFETEHVGLVEVLNRIANVLSAGGI